MLARLAQLLACPACAAGDYQDGAIRALFLGALIVAPVLIAALLIPTIARIVRDGGKDEG